MELKGRKRFNFEFCSLKNYIVSIKQIILLNLLKIREDYFSIVAKESLLKKCDFSKKVLVPLEIVSTNTFR